MTHRKLKPRRLAAVLAGLTVTGLVTTSLFVSAGGASAAELDLTYTCTFPVIEQQPVKVHINAAIPDTITAGVPTGKFQIEALATLNEDTTLGLKLVKVASIEGSTTASAHISAPGFETDLDIPIKVEKTAIPASGGFTVRATGETPSLTFKEAGPIKITVGDLLMTITARKADGTLAAVPNATNPFDAPCPLDPGQNNVLKEGQILPNPGTTTTIGTSTTTQPTTTEPTTTQPTTTEPTTTEPTTTEPTTTQPTTTEPTTTEPTTTEPTTTQPTTTEPTTTQPTTTEPTTTQPTTTEPTTTQPTTTEPTTTEPTTTEPTTTQPTTTEPTTTEPTTTEPTTTQPTTTEPTTTQPTTTQPTTTAPTTTTTQPPGAVVDVSYTVKGKTYITKLNVSALIGPGKLEAKIKMAEGTFAGDLSLPSTKVGFTLFGFLPAQATVKIVPSGSVTGTIAADGTVKSNVAVDLVLANVKVFGLAIGGGPSCKSSTTVALASQAGFDVHKGGTLTGTYDIPPFANCGMFTSIINSLAAGSGNKIELALTKK